MSDVSFLRYCYMCGKRDLKLVYRWYKYDNGEQFRAPVCPGCSALHQSLGGK